MRSLLVVCWSQCDGGHQSFQGGSARRSHAVFEPSSRHRCGKCGGYGGTGCTVSRRTFWAIVHESDYTDYSNARYIACTMYSAHWIFWGGGAGRGKIVRTIHRSFEIKIQEILVPVLLFVFNQLKI